MKKIEKYWKYSKSKHMSQSHRTWLKRRLHNGDGNCGEEGNGQWPPGHRIWKILFVFFFPFGCKTSQKIGLKYSEIVPSTQYDQNQKYAFALVSPSFFLVPLYSHFTRYANHKCHRSESIRACQTNLCANMLQKMAAILHPLAFMCWINSLIKKTDEMNYAFSHSPLK